MAYPDVRVYLGMTAAAFSDENTWEDITDWAQTIDCRYGRSSHLDEFQPGGGTVRLLNHDGRFDPANTFGPYYPDLRPRNRLKIEATISEPLIDDEFPGSALDSGTWSTVGSGGVSVGSGAVTVTSSTSATTRGFATAGTVDFYDLAVTTHCQMSATPWPTSAGFRPIDISLGSERAYFELAVGSILALRTFDGVTTAVWTASHSNTTHAYLRIRRAGHATYWETSSDGSAWTTQYSEDLGWAVPWGATVRAVAITSSAEGTTDTMTLSFYEIGHTATHPIAYGWVDGWAQDQPGRKDAYVDVTWSDALTMLARGSMPDSVYDYVVDGLDPYIWYKLNDETNVANDYSGNGNHGAYRWFELLEWPPEGRLLPDSIVQDAAADAVIPQTGRPGKNWAQLQADVGQPLGGVPYGAPRTPVIATGYLAAGLWSDNAVTLETWVIFRQAYPVDDNGHISSTTPVRQPLMTFGNYWHAHAMFFLDDDGDLVLTLNDVSGGTPGGITAAAGNVYDANPHHVVAVISDSGGDMIGTLYVDGAQVGTANFGTPDNPGGLPLVVGQAEYTPNVSSLQSTLGDVIVYNSSLSAADVEALYNAGAYGTLDTNTRLTAGQMISQALEMAGWEVTSDIDLTGAYVKPEVPNGVSALEWCRKASKSERGVLYQRPNGELTFHTRDWQTQQGRSTGYHWWLSDSGVTELGFSSGLGFQYDDESMVNDATASWPGGEQSAVNSSSVTTYGRIKATIDTSLDTGDAAQQAAEWQVYAYGAPRLRVTEPLLLAPVDTVDFAAACAVEFGSRVRVTHTTADARTVVNDYWAQAVRHQIEPGRLGWRTFVTLDKADDPAPLFRIDGAVQADGSPLDSGDVLTF